MIDIPDELVRIVIGYMSFNDRLNMCSVNRRWSVDAFPSHVAAVVRIPLIRRAHAEDIPESFIRSRMRFIRKIRFVFQITNRTMGYNRDDWVHGLCGTIQRRVQRKNRYIRNLVSSHMIPVNDPIELEFVLRTASPFFLLPPGSLRWYMDRMTNSVFIDRIISRQAQEWLGLHKSGLITINQELMST